MRITQRRWPLNVVSGDTEQGKPSLVRIKSDPYVLSDSTPPPGSLGRQEDANLGQGLPRILAAVVVETVTGQEARDHIDELSQKYHGQDYNPDDIKSERVMLWIVPSRQTFVDQTAGSI